MTTLSISELTERMAQLKQEETHLLEMGADVEKVWDEMDRTEAKLERARLVLEADAAEMLRREASARGDWVESAKWQTQRNELDRAANNRRHVVRGNKVTDPKWTEEKTVWVLR